MTPTGIADRLPVRLSFLFVSVGYFKKPVGTLKLVLDWLRCLNRFWGKGQGCHNVALNNNWRTRVLSHLKNLQLLRQVEPGCEVYCTTVLKCN